MKVDERNRYVTRIVEPYTLYSGMAKKMRLALKINGTPRVIAALKSPGYLSAHLNVHDRATKNDYSKKIRIVGIQTLETESVRFDWPELDIQVGDTVELQLQDSSDGDPPVATHASSQSPDNLFSHPALAKELVEVVSGFEERLMQLIEKSKKTESAEENKRFAKAVGRVVTGLGECFLDPVYRRHKELIPDELKGELL